MGHIATTIIPIFSLVALGGIARHRGFLSPEFMGPANRLVYYLAIPAMIFRAISKASLTQQFNPTVLGLTLMLSSDCSPSVGWPADGYRFPSTSVVPLFSAHSMAI